MSLNVFPKKKKKNFESAVSSFSIIFFCLPNHTRKKQTNCLLENFVLFDERIIIEREHLSLLSENAKSSNCTKQSLEKQLPIFSFPLHSFRYSRSSNHQQLYYDPNLYQRQFSQQQNSTMLDNSYVNDRERQVHSLSRQHSLTKSYNVYSESTRCA